MRDTPLTLEIYTDYVCPWCYLASDTVARLGSRDDLQIKWVPFPLHPDTPPQGMNLKEWLGDGVDQAHQRLYGIMDRIGLEYDPDRVMTWNSRLAQELGMWGDTQAGGGAALHRALFRAYFVHNRNISDQAVLLDCVKEAGMDVDAARTVLDTRSFSDAVDAAWQDARHKRISGVPSFIAGSYITSGYHPVEELEKFIEYAETQQARLG